MAKSNPRLLITADALSRAADAIRTQADGLSKNRILNAMAAAIAGPGHDWGFLKNTPGNLFTQPGLALPSAPVPDPVSSPDSVWLVLFDEREDWSREPMVFDSKTSALAHIAEIHPQWRHKDHSFEIVMAALEREGRYIFALDPEDDPEAYENASPYSLELLEKKIEKRTPRDFTAPDPSTCFIALLLDDSDIGISLDRNEDLIFSDREALEAHLAKGGLDLSEFLGDIHLARDCDIEAEFAPEAWQNKYAVPVDPQGPTTWSIDPCELDPDQTFFDDLVRSRNAPSWVRDWSGPFTLSITITPRTR